MSRPKKDPIEKALDAYDELTPGQRDEFLRVVQRLNKIRGVPKPRKPRPNPVPLSEGPSEA